MYYLVGRAKSFLGIGAQGTFAGWFRPGATPLSLPLSSVAFWLFAFGCMHTTGTKNWGNSPGKANGWIETDNSLMSAVHMDYQMLTLLHHC